MMVTRAELFNEYFFQGFREIRTSPENYREILMILDGDELDEAIRKRTFHGISIVLIDKKGEKISWPEEKKCFCGRGVIFNRVLCKKCIAEATLRYKDLKKAMKGGWRKKKK